MYMYGEEEVALELVAKPHFPWTKIVISSDEKKTDVTQPSRTFRG